MPSNNSSWSNRLVPYHRTIFCTNPYIVVEANCVANSGPNAFRRQTWSGRAGMYDFHVFDWPMQWLLWLYKPCYFQNCTPLCPKPVLHLLSLPFLLNNLFTVLDMIFNPPHPWFVHPECPARNKKSWTSHNFCSVPKCDVLKQRRQLHVAHFQDQIQWCPYAKWMLETIEKCLGQLVYLKDICVKIGWGAITEYITPFLQAQITIVAALLSLFWQEKDFQKTLPQKTKVLIHHFVSKGNRWLRHTIAAHRVEHSLFRLLEWHAYGSVSSFCISSQTPETCLVAKSFINRLSIEVRKRKKARIRGPIRNTFSP